ncbi:DNA binding domain [uncultured Mediterranean phage uvMED]|jgi:transcriptional regulator with XRE-family HTH domain|nr:DNA binding domain [uncultured Mediterranean phage uvMED]BAR16084.1 prophage pi1 protein 03 [uncultured Mediterranean phage uvMED]BAR16149.1 prophage pi1 protein 03 [uncultured Mediterranean phage uvMED]
MHIKANMAKSIKLEQYRQSKKLTHKKLGDLLGTDQSTAYRWCNGERIPKPKHMKIISEKTEGKVNALSFYE